MSITKTRIKEVIEKNKVKIVIGLAFVGTLAVAVAMTKKQTEKEGEPKAKPQERKRYDNYMLSNIDHEDFGWTAILSVPEGAVGVEYLDKMLEDVAKDNYNLEQL